MTYRIDVALSDEDVSFAKRDPPFDDLGCPRHDEQRVAVLLQLGMLMGFSGVLDGQRVKIELGLNALQQLRAGFEQTNPDDMTVLLRPPTGVVDDDVCDPPAEGIDTGSNHTRLVALGPAIR